MWYKLYANCLITSGHKKSLLIDTQLNYFYEIPSDIAKILETLNKGISFLDLIKEFETNEITEIEKYINWFVEKNFVFKIEDKSELNLFPDLNLNFYYPKEISNAIIVISTENLECFGEILRQINELDISYLEIRIEANVDINFLNKLGLLVEDTLVEEVTLFLNDSNFDIIEIKEICNKYLRIKGVNIYNTTIEAEEKLHGDDTSIFFSKANYPTNKCCGNIVAENFIVNIEYYTETQSFNSCLNRKIAIDGLGNIKNCPSMKQSFGNINDTSLTEAINKSGFKKYWNINKDKIKVCQDCEFRYICTDCRAYTENPEDIYSKPLKCGYDPYTGEWSEWSTNPLKQKAIKYYSMEDLVKKDV
jgi:SPASM domain peptide maturase of grasp-with-spasm system